VPATGARAGLLQAPAGSDVPRAPRFSACCARTATRRRPAIDGYAVRCGGLPRSWRAARRL